MTPLERPKQFGLRATMTDAELADLKRRAQKMMDGGDAFFAEELFTAALEGKTKFSSSDTQVGNYDQTWLSDRVWTTAPRSSSIRRTAGFRLRRLARPSAHGHRLLPSEPEGRRIAPGLVAGHPLYQLRHAEHPRRLSKLLRDHPGSGHRRAAQRDDSRRAHLLDRRRAAHRGGDQAYHGDSRARWDGDTFVVDTTNYVANATRVGASDTLHTTEKFRRVAQDTLDIRHLRRPDRVVAPMDADDSAQDDRRAHVEDACHEGNYGLPAILRGARELEKNSTR